MNRKAHRYIQVFLGFLLVLYLISLYHRKPDNDEAILAEHSYWLVQEGTPKGVMYAGMGVGWEDRLYVYHRLFVLTGAVLIKSLGLSLLSLRLFMLAMVGAFCYVLRSYWRRYFRDIHTEGFTLSMILVFSYALFITFSYMWRPEIMVMTFGFLGFYFLKSFLDKASTLHLILGGIFTGMAALTHLNGVIFIGAGGLVLLFHRRWGHAILFGLAGAIVALGYFWDIRSPEAFEALRWQFGNDPVLEDKDFAWYAPILKVLNDHKRYFHSPREAAFAFLLLTSLMAGGNRIFKKHKALVIYGGSAALALAAISHGHTSKYGLLLLPYMVLAIVHVYLSLDSVKGKRAIAGVFVLFAIVQSYYIYDLLGGRVDLGKRNREIAASIPAGEPVYGPATFFFNEVENYPLYTTQAYNLRVNRYFNLTWSKEDFFGFAREMGASYVVIDFKLQNNLIYKTFTEQEVQTGSSWFGYEVIERGKDYAVLKRL